ncbi:splicing factor 3B subunit 4 [Bombina bombina]|uniref:splicing factor 3B subunit 4 n=1 Tax=Bombina bombina TaxID=8345 RepID=UPI00235A720A|nr:splicing factor 3B subunit 4 [Bombina bombina]
MAAGPISERNQDATVYVGGLDEKVSEPLLWELFLQAGPVVNTHMPKDRVTGQHQGYGFVEFLSEEDADYAIKIMNMIKLYGKPIRVNKASAHNKNLDVGANIFIGNLDPEIDEKLLYDTFSAFGVILQTPKIMRDPDTGNSKGYAFINFASFDASDASIEAMNGQYLCNRPITVSYAFKKESKGERHGSAAERLLAAQNPLSQADRPHQLFADAPPTPAVPAVISSMTSAVAAGMPTFPPVPPPGAMPPGMPPTMPPPPMSPLTAAGQASAAASAGTHPQLPHPFQTAMHHGMQMQVQHPNMAPSHPGAAQMQSRPPGMPGPPPMGMPPRAPPFGTMGHPAMPPGMRPPPLMPPHGYSVPPRPPPYGYQRGPLPPPPRPVVRPPAPPRVPMRLPMTQ